MRYARSAGRTVSDESRVIDGGAAARALDSLAAHFTLLSCPLMLYRAMAYGTVVDGFLGGSKFGYSWLDEWPRRHLK